MEAQHQIYDLLDDAAETQVELDQVLEEFYQGDEIRGKVEEGLQVKIKAIEAEIARTASTDRRSVSRLPVVWK